MPAIFKTATFFRSPKAFQKWIEENHERASELWVGFFKRDSGKGGLTYQEALDEALCRGWIDGIRKRIDDISFTIRFTPRKPKSVWSLVNIKRVEELEKLGRMAPGGIEAFRQRSERKSGIYSHEQGPVQLASVYEKQMKTNKAAWRFFQEQAPSYQRAASWWVNSAKKEETRQKRLARLIGDSEGGRRLTHLVSKK